MLKPTDKVAVWMESSLDDDYGKMGISALRYLDNEILCVCLLYTSPSPRDGLLSRMPSSA